MSEKGARRETGAPQACQLSISCKFLTLGVGRLKELVGILLSFPAGNLNQEVRKLQAGLDQVHLPFQMSLGTASSNSRRCFCWGQLLRSIRNSSGQILVLSIAAKHTCTSAGFHSGHLLHHLGHLSLSIRQSLFLCHCLQYVPKAPVQKQHH